MGERKPEFFTTETLSFIVRLSEVGRYGFVCCSAFCFQ
jgi:hypothetical protein